MKSFLKEVLLEVQNTQDTISDLVFLVPSKRAGLFLKKELLDLYKNETIFVPEIFSIEEFITQISGLQQIDNIQALFEFYETYLNTNSHLRKENFETFSNWAQTLIYDFNEIDRYCIDHNSFFAYLSNIQDINHWYLQKEKTELIQEYIRFWESLPEYYNNFKERLLAKKIGYQGLLYRKASDDIQGYIKVESRQHILVGFNALNNAEQRIFQTLLKEGMAEAYWDSDQFFLENPYHEASLFLRNYKNQWDYYKQNPFKWINNNFSLQKDIKLVGVPKNVGQAKSIGKILAGISESEMEKTALVLADENLLQPTLTSLPNTIKSVNITMGLPLKEVPISGFFEQLFNLHENNTSKGFYFKSVLEILSNFVSYRLMGITSRHLITTISKENLVYITQDKLQELVGDDKKEIVRLLFDPWENVTTTLNNCREIIQLLKRNIGKEGSAMELEYVYHFHVVFNKLTTLHSNYQYLTSIRALHTLYKDMLTTESLDFSGEPFAGLQLMGMLESRCLDFETVIISSVNEGVLPAGKSTNSFIPYDLKRAYNLPTYKEKDAIYTYHFYRLIQRAKKVYLMYNTEDEGVGGGEKSRFLLQLDIDKRPNHKISKYTVSSEVPKLTHELIRVEKNKEILDKLKALAGHGLSPSALTTYIRNPIDFYYKYILGIRETDEVEETIAANTLGTVIHNTLETFYKPLEHTFLTIENIKEMKGEIDSELCKQFYNEYAQLDITQGKNLLIYEVAKRYIHNFLTSEERLLNQGTQLKIVAIESNLKTQIKIPELDFPIYIKGKVDRIDELDGKTRVIDYKTGKVNKSDVVLMDWEEVTLDYKYSKAIQILAYGYMYYNENIIAQAFEAGIISFKNLQEGFLRFGTKESVRSKPNHDITSEVFDEYLTQLKNLIVEIFDSKIPFIEKEV
ncbi:PD-(D/E)XK nuclease family protein [Aquimarina gracilis]|uniref:PD-(D/E)XK nuclease family protein n=1 Tax=Aquimarina gracilis TaxID=874422 RepID=A0ABU6A147_9FLAO|nr:PD-(D/E)XK nuclease family protein [Aquimarina gracilis]MEB3347877.1 PD-(D/E)XK nuclease family protein [Aquimarina gracilis]